MHGERPPQARRRPEGAGRHRADDRRQLDLLTVGHETLRHFHGEIAAVGVAHERVGTVGWTSRIARTTAPAVSSSDSKVERAASRLMDFEGEDGPRRAESQRQCAELDGDAA